MYPSDTAHRNEIFQEYKEAICALERDVNAVTKELEDKHPAEILKYLENPEKNVANRHISRIRFERQKKQEMRERRMHARIPESYIAGRSDEDITYVMPADAIQVIQPPPSVTGKKLINFWSRHQQEAMTNQAKLQQLKRNFDPSPKAVSGPSGQQVVYVDICSNVVGDGRRPGASGQASSGMPPVG